MNIQNYYRQGTKNEAQQQGLTGLNMIKIICGSGPRKSNLIKKTDLGGYNK